MTAMPRPADVLDFSESFIAARTPVAGFVLIRKDGKRPQFFAGQVLAHDGAILPVWTTRRDLAFPWQHEVAAEAGAAVVRARMREPAAVYVRSLDAPDVPAY